MGRHQPGIGANAFPVILIVGVAVLVATLAIAGTVYARRGMTEPTVAGRTRCPTTVSVVTAASFAPVLEALAPRLSTSDRDTCVRIDVDVVDGRAAPARVAQTDADVWIPDDAAWAGKAGTTELAAKDTAGSGTVLATSPIFMVADRVAAERLKQAGGSWLALANLAGEASGVRLALRDPDTSGDGMVAAGAVGEAVWITKGMDASAMALAKAHGRARTVGGSGPALPAGSGEVGLVPEYALLPELPGIPAGTEVLAGTDHTAMLRYPWLPTAAAAQEPNRAAPLARLLDALRGARGAEAIQAARLRGPDATPLGGAPATGLPATSAKPLDVLGRHHVDHVFATWNPRDRRTSLLIVVDVSGSMARPAPGTSTPIIQLVRQGCLSLADLLPDDARLGLWEFGAEIAPPNDYRQVLAPVQLAQGHRTNWKNAVGGLAAERNGTGLYDTILAAYTSARDTYQADLPNHVFVFTDAVNEADPDSISLADLTARLSAAEDPKRPVALSVVAYGQKDQAAQLEKALKPIDGSVNTPQTADEVDAVFIHVAAGGLHG